MSNVYLNNDGSIGLALSNQTELDDSDRQRILPLEQKSSQLTSVEINFKEAVNTLKIKLLDNPDYVKLLKLQDKICQVRKMKKEVVIILSNEYKEVFKKQGINTDQLTDIYSELLPDSNKTGKRGRPRKELTNG